MELPRTKQGNIIHKRDYIVELRTRDDITDTLLQWTTTLKAKNEFLKHHQPALLYYRNKKKYNHYLLTLSNVSSKITRTQFADLLIDLKKDNTVIPNNLRIKWETGNMETEEFNIEGDTQLLKELLLGDKKVRQERETGIATPFPDDITQLLEIQLHLPNDVLISPNQENVAPNEQDQIKEALKGIENYNWEEMEVEQVVERQKTTRNLPTLYKGLPADRSKWTEGDWKRVKQINQWKKNMPPSSSDKNQPQEQEEDNPASPLRITVTTGTSRSGSLATTSQDPGIQSAPSLTLITTLATKQQQQQLLSGKTK